MKVGELARRDYSAIGPDLGVAAVEDQLMRQGSLVVTEDGEFLGMLTAAEVVRYGHRLVRDCLGDLPRLDYGKELEPVFNLMREAHFCVLPVFKDDLFFGVLSLEDITDYYLFRYRRELEEEVASRVTALHEANKQLSEEINLRREAEKELQAAHDRLDEKVSERTAELLAANLQLQKALDEIKALKGILPLCSFCKKIRNEQGAWEQVDIYLHEHSGADVSHCVCPSCLKNHYPSYEELEEEFGGEKSLNGSAPSFPKN